MNRKTIKRTGGKQRVEGKPFCLAKEVDSIQRGAFLYTDRGSGRVVATLGYPTAKIARLG